MCAQRLLIGLKVADLRFVLFCACESRLFGFCAFFAYESHLFALCAFSCVRKFFVKKNKLEITLIPSIYTITGIVHIK